MNVRAWLILARASNLPTVWSNCIAASLIGGGGNVLLMCVAASLLYTGGMFLNDVCDVRFDRQHKRDRPIIAGTLTARAAGIAAMLLLVFGVALLGTISYRALVFGALLALAIVAYDVLHKHIRWAPWLMGTCRFLLYLTAAATMTPRVFIAACVMALYVAGLSYVARVVRSRKGDRAVSMLLAGIVLVDVLLVSPVSLQLYIIFAALFGATLLFQRYVPAT